MAQKNSHPQSIKETAFDCPHCGARHMSPYDSEELTTLIEEEGKEFVVFWSPETAEHEPDSPGLLGERKRG